MTNYISMATKAGVILHRYVSQMLTFVSIIKIAYK